MRSLIVLCLAVFCLQAVFSQDAATTLVYISSYADVSSPSIYLYQLDTTIGALELLDTVKGVYNPSYITFDSTLGYLYAANEGDDNGTVSSFSVDSTTGKLTYLNQKPSPGGPCFVSVDHTDGVLMSADYGAGNVRVFPILNNGSLGDQTDMVQHNGSSINPDRQAGPHAHMIMADPTNKFAFAVDLGLDKILGYVLDPVLGTITPNDPYTAFDTEAGAGPRHYVYHPNGKNAFLIHEMGSIIISLSYDSDKGIFTSLQTISTLPSDFTGESAAAAIRISKDGKFLYGSNRGHNSIAVFSINQDTFELTNIQYISTAGKTPRDFNFDHSGKILIAANQDSSNVVTYLVDTKTGLLTESGFQYYVSSPTCVQSTPDSTGEVVVV